MKSLDALRVHDTSEGPRHEVATDVKSRLTPVGFAGYQTAGVVISGAGYSSRCDLAEYTTPTQGEEAGILSSVRPRACTLAVTSTSRVAKTDPVEPL
jgi:hypothetical protein